MAVLERASERSAEKKRGKEHSSYPERQWSGKISPAEFMRRLESEVGTLRAETVAELERIKNDSGLLPSEIWEAAQEAGLPESLRQIDREAGELESEARVFLDRLIDEGVLLKRERSVVEARIGEFSSKREMDDLEKGELSYLGLKKDVIDLELFRNRVALMDMDESESEVRPGERKEKADLPEPVRSVLDNIDRIAEMVEEKKYDYRKIRALEYSEDVEDRDLFSKISGAFDAISEEQKVGMDMLMDLGPDVILDLAESVEHPFSKAVLIDNCAGFSGEKSFPLRRFLEAAHGCDLDVSEYETRVHRQIVSEKKSLLKSLPIDDFFSELMSDERLLKDGPLGLGNSMEGIGQEIERLLYAENFSELGDIAGKLRALDKRMLELSGQHIPIESIRKLFPEIWSSVDPKSIFDILEGKMSQEFFDEHRWIMREEGNLMKLVPRRGFRVAAVGDFLMKRLEKGFGLTKDELHAVLSEQGLVFSGLDVRRKADVLRALTDEESIMEFFTAEDIRDILAMGNLFIKPGKIPKIYRRQFRQEIARMIQEIARMISENIASEEERKLAYSSFDLADFKAMLESGFFVRPEDVSDAIRADLKDDFIKIGVRQARNKDESSEVIIGYPEYREGVFQALSDQESERGEDGKAVAGLRNLRDSFRVLEHPEMLPREFSELASRFEGRYGKRGKYLVALAITAYGTDDPEIFRKRMEPIERVLDRYYEEVVPDGAHVSTGIEYEVTDSISETYDKRSVLGYVKDIELASHSGFIGVGFGGTGAIYEIATKPTYNPYMLLAERRLLQDAGFIDFNFERYPNASRGYHLNLGGESGLWVDKDMRFMMNMMTMAQLNGIVAGNEVRGSSRMFSNTLDAFEGNEQEGARVELKGAGCDTVEQFERAVITTHHAGIATQLCNRYISDFPPELLSEISDDPAVFERMMETTGRLETPFSDIRERDMVHAWLILQREIVAAVEQHNSSFFESEFDGSFINAHGEYIDTGEQIDVMRNRRLLSEEERRSVTLDERLRINPEWLFQEPKPEFENALTRTNNIFLKGLQHGSISSVNAGSALMTMKCEGSLDIVEGRPQESMFDRSDGKLRDGYYCIQGASEEMVTHKSQILLNRFNKAMEVLLRMPVTKGTAVEV